MFEKKTLQANINRAERLTENQTRYQDHNNKLKNIFSSFDLI